MAAITGAISLLPEVIKGYKSHHLQDVSWGMLWLMFANSLLWGWYGNGTDDFPLIASAMINLLLTGMLLGMKQHYKLTGKPLFHFLKKKNENKKLQTALETETVEPVDTPTNKKNQ